ncbi:MMPL family transporter [Acidithiobacillus ferriphilus]|uniref:MMPL family transporter n=1 Tax=Acidithiobacillus ferriphilus TaxID=1689834 RepID=UPI00232CBF0D|nr:MMPL family transporter [Acidithiobacillus ferriphilus]WCE93637.1 MMPL family transporter [Acidithiobacillus ferriphilus]
MRKFRWLVLGVWLAILIGAIGVIINTKFESTLSEFLPKSPSAQQELLNEQLRNGVLSRKILVEINGGDAATRARISAQMVLDLRKYKQFELVSNGNAGVNSQIYSYLFMHRYVLSAATKPELFSVKGLHDAIEKTLNNLAGPGGEAMAALFPSDPTGAMIGMAKGIGGMSKPRVLDGVWASSTGDSALLLLQTRFPGSDSDAQQQAIATIKKIFKLAQRDMGSSGQGTRLQLTGVGVISVAARNTIVHAAESMSLISGTLIIMLLLFVYRSLVVLVYSLVPVMSGVIVGIAAVSLGFGMVYDITLGFGTALIGEAVDYSIYFFVQTGEMATGAELWKKNYWPIIRLGVFTSVVGFASLLFSNLPGLAQLGLYAITGLLTAAGVTRLVLSRLPAHHFKRRDFERVGDVLLDVMRMLSSARWIVISLTIIASGILLVHRDHIWSHELSALSPVPKADQLLYAKLRKDMGIPDEGYLLVVSGATRNLALENASKIDPLLERLQISGIIGGFETPTRFLPGMESQVERRSALPSEPVLITRLEAAVRGLPVSASRLSPFVQAVERERKLPLLTYAELPAGVQQIVDSMLVHHGQEWSVLLPIIAPSSGKIDSKAVQAAMMHHHIDDAIFVDISGATNTLYSGYIRNALKLSLAGVLGIIILLLAVFRSVIRVVRIMLPLIAAVLVVVAAFVVMGVELNIMNLIGLMLIVAVGSNYALFFDRGGQMNREGSSRTLLSLVVANMATVIGFAPLAFSGVPVLQAIGATVAPGVILALLFSASLVERRGLL